MVSSSQALIPALTIDSSLLKKGFIVMGGVIALSLLAQVAIPLPFTPVPVTGQTFGVLLLGLAFGRKLAFSTMLSYLVVGAVGLPVFANARAGLAFVPTSGYLLGMLLSTWIVGGLADRGWTRKPVLLFAACLISSSCIFGCGLLVLSQFVPADKLFISGLYPFLLGDVVKSLTAIALIRPAHRLLA